MVVFKLTVRSSLVLLPVQQKKRLLALFIYMKSNNCEYYNGQRELQFIVFDVKGFYRNILWASFLFKYLSIFRIKLNGTTAYSLFGKKRL